MAAFARRLVVNPSKLFRSCHVQFTNKINLCSAAGEGVSKYVAPEDKVTHTGQHWENDDSRMARFINRTKQVNEQFAIDLINSIPPKIVKERVTWCDGGGGALGHPKVYINVDQPGPHACGYCGLRFELDQSHH